MINQWDEAKHRGITIDLNRLAAEFGVEVLTCVAVKDEGIEEIKAAVAKARPGKIRPELLELIEPILNQSTSAKEITQAMAVLIVEGDEPTATPSGCCVLPAIEQRYTASAASSSTT